MTVARPRRRSVLGHAPPDSRHPGLTVPAGSRPLPRRFRLLVPIILLTAPLCGSTKGEEPAARPLRVRVQLSAAPYYMGQPITLQVSVIAHDERPAVIPPRIVGAD